MKVVAIIQARMGSARLPNKVMRMIGDAPMIDRVVDRLKRTTEIDQIVVATSVDPRNDPLVAHLEERGTAWFRGSEDDVLSRYHQAGAVHGADIVVRITADCPLIDPQVVDEAVRLLKSTGADFTGNVAPATFPDGLDVEVMTFAALSRAAAEAQSTFEREHVTPYLRNGDFKRANLSNDVDLSGMRWTVDEAADLEVAKNIYAHFAPRTDFGWREVLSLHNSAPELFTANATIARTSGTDLTRGQKLWRRAKQIIPGGNMLLSKRSEMHLPEQWPSYFSKTKGCRVWDLDGRELIDMYLMGVGTNTLGYSHDEVDRAVLDVVRDGNMSTLNCPEEVLLAERLIELHPWADMARFARSGGEANAIAIRIARAASGRDKVAVCGYHGWHDWYLSANLADDASLDGHLLPGLEPKGVPKGLRGTVLPFQYNDIDALKKLVAEHEIGVIKMEVSRNMGPAEGFLEAVRDLATENGIVLIFDECTSGFRQTFGGLHKLYGVEPDMAIFGKALGNGYAITATIGRREVMEAAQSTFISSTFWTERIGPAAAVRTLRIMEEERSWERITATGLDVRARWQALADLEGIKIDHWGLPALTGFTVRSSNALAYKTLITQEMLRKGYLAATSLYVSLAHTPDIIDRYFDDLQPVFRLIRECEDGRDVMALLDGPVCHQGFKRIN